MKYTGRNGWQVSFKDTFSLDHTLSPIIGAALVKFKSTITEGGDHRKGIPVDWMCAKVEEGVVSWEDETNWIMSDEDSDKCFELWLEMLDKCVYAFTVAEPDISDYYFTYVSGEHDGEASEFGTVRWHKVCTNEDESKRYDEDMKIHNEKVKKGHQLFGLWLSTMWW